MSDAREALLFLDLDKGANDAGPLFDEPRRRLESDPALRAAWAQYQALRALAWECAPEPGEKLIRLALAESKRERVKQQLARSTGSEDLAREILLGRVRERRGLPGWAWLLVLVLAAGLTWLLLGPQIQALLWPEPGLPPAAAPLPSSPAPGSGDDAAVPFEFPAQTPPAQAALSAPAAEPGADDTQDVKREDRASAEARKLLREHLKAQERSQEPARPEPTPVPTTPQRRPPPSKPTPPPAMAAAVPRPKPTPKPTPRPTAEPTPAPTALPTALPTAAPTARPAAEAEASFSLSAPSARPGGRLSISLGLPERREIDLRLFDQRGRPVKALISGEQGPGSQQIPLQTVDDAGKPLAPGTYYLRVMTPWFSRVEPIEITE